ncbi:hypothetical protein GCM10009759_72430 [Kitasatospora saccharophila]|uniref:Uncharacterized protein n=1 Tax=Kitasatospora saccharophila TaxID=407973 RepID=A0ABP5JWR3_9ACTN
MNPDQRPSASVNYGVIVGGDLTGSVQNAPAARDSTLHQTAGSAAADLAEARRCLGDLREALLQHRHELSDPQACLDELAVVEQHLPRAAEARTTLRAVMRSLYGRCGGVPGLFTIAGVAQQAVAALL